MKENDEIKKKLEEELKWVIYRQKMLDIIEEKLLKMKELATKAKDDNITSEELKNIQMNIDKLATQIKALDEESRL
ncbi:hypothetical protein [Clostridium intestinale]|jgi:flagellin-like hook-associated protein FlgL|uniref:Uncharacterized protein n=1 Tax=Clostridium intestinale URNW TaxID=1294142 RepID=U2NR07_9CLOT|nr:hypothetical protein [Clostridium intestinale]ERK31593.1 hypothetical protein CINTURNW_0864 [Clostridium intestinale URNW]